MTLQCFSFIHAHCSKPPFFVQKFNFSKTLNLVFEYNLTEYFESKIAKNSIISSFRPEIGRN